MSIVGGSFSETQLLEIRLLADRIMFNDRIKQQFIPQYEILNAIAANQTARITPLEASNKNYEVKVEWMNACDIDHQAIANCDFCDTELSTNTEEYALDIEQEVCFMVDEYKFINNDFDFQLAIAKGALMADKVLTEYLAGQAVARVEAFKGVNEFDGGKGVVSGTDTYILPAYWDATLGVYFNRVGILNRFTNPWFLSGSNLYEQAMVARYNSGNDNGKGAAAMYGSLRMYWDLFNIDTYNDPDLKTYMISDGAMAMASKAYYKGVGEGSPAVYFTEKRWSMPSRFMPGVTLDVYYTNECGTDNFYKHKYRYILRAGIFNNPAGCTATNTGVLSFVCGTTPT
jgi:hypothetical protein